MDPVLLLREGPVSQLRIKERCARQDVPLSQVKGRLVDLTLQFPLLCGIPYESAYA